jgi:hypothetical protein
MKHAIVFGCGGENGLPIIDSLVRNNFMVLNVGSKDLQIKNVENINIDWNDLDIPTIHKNFSKLSHDIDFIFFNQNSSTLTASDFDVTANDTVSVWQQVKNWSKAQWLSCQLPFLVIHTIKDRLTSDSKIGWMLSAYTDHGVKGVCDYPDYSSFKFTNYLIMKSFGINSNLKTFGIIPDFAQQDSKQDLGKLVEKIVKEDIESQTIYKI